MRPALPDREFAIRAALLVAALVAAVLVLRGAAQVLPPGLPLAAALLGVLLVPGLACARILGVDEQLEAPVLLAAAIPLGCAVWSLGLMAALIVGLPLTALALIVGVACAVALAASTPRIHTSGSGAQLAGVAAAGALMAVLASRYETVLQGDALFHAGRVRKLLDLPHLTLSGLSSVWHGSPHAGYVVPVLHAIEAVAIRITGSEPSAAYSSLAPGCALLLPLAAYALGSAAAGRPVGAAAALLACWDALARGSLAVLQQPPEFTFYVLIPALLALLAACARGGFDRRLSRAVLLGVLAVTLIHASYTVLVLACIAGVVIVMLRGWLLLAASVALTGVIYGVIWAVALRGGTRLPRPPVLDTVYVVVHGNPVIARAGWMLDSRPEIAVGVLSVVPLMLLFRRRHAVPAAIMGAALVLCSFPWVPALLTSVLGYGQVKRFPRSGLPWALTAAIVVVEVAAVAGGRMAVPVALAVAVASLGYQAYVPEGDPLTFAIAALTVAGVAVSAWPALRGRNARVNAAAPAALGAVVLLAAALIAGSVRAQRTEVVSDLRHGPGVSVVQPRLPEPVIGFFRQHDGAPFPVVLAEAYIGYQLAGEATVYPMALPLERARGEPRNMPVARKRAVNIALEPGTSPAARAAILDRFQVRYLLVNTKTTPRAVAALSADPGLREVFRYGDWAAFARP
jgi:hypothetical protein